MNRGIWYNGIGRVEARINRLYSKTQPLPKKIYGGVHVDHQATLQPGDIDHMLWVVRKHGGAK